MRAKGVFVIAVVMLLSSRFLREQDRRRLALRAVSEVNCVEGVSGGHLRWGQSRWLPVLTINPKPEAKAEAN